MLKGLARKGHPYRDRYTTSVIDCPHCGRRASFHGYREKTVATLGGPVTCNRAYYYCGLCAQGSCPWDGRVGLTTQRLSPAVERLATLCGAVADSFEKGTELLKETAGIRLGESTVQRTTEATGQRIAEHMQKGRTFRGKEAWDWFRDACGRTVGYIGIDATGVRQQGPHGEAADGRMAYVGMVFNPLPDRERVFEGLPKPGVSMKARYVSGLYPLAEMGPLIRRQGAQVGLDRAKVWVALVWWSRRRPLTQPSPRKTGARETNASLLTTRSINVKRPAGYPLHQHRCVASSGQVEAKHEFTATLVQFVGGCGVAQVSGASARGAVALREERLLHPLHLQFRKCQALCL